MSLQIACPHCDQIQAPSIRVTASQVAASMLPDPSGSRKAWRVPLVLALSLTIVGLPVADWLVKRFERDDAGCTRTVYRYECQCSRCGFKWSWQTSELLTQEVPWIPSKHSTQPKFFLSWFHVQH